mgnify:FL=1
MTTNNQCNHALAIAKDLYNVYQSVLSHAPKEMGWEDEPTYVRQAWYHVADQALPIIGKHALGDIRDYLGIKASGTSGWWKKALLGLASAAVGALGLSLFQGCGHSVDVTPDHTTICKDGSCLVIEQGHISYSQAQPTTDVPPVVQATKK